MSKTIASILRVETIRCFNEFFRKFVEVFLDSLVGRPVSLHLLRFFFEFQNIHHQVHVTHWIKCDFGYFIFGPVWRHFSGAEYTIRHPHFVSQHHLYTSKFKISNTRDFVIKMDSFTFISIEIVQKCSWLRWKLILNFNDFFVCSYGNQERLYN